MSKKSFWPIVLTIFFIVLIVFLVGFWIFASQLKYDLVTEDYYQEELKYQDQIDRIERARSLSSPIILSEETGSLLINYPVEMHSIPLDGNIVLFRPSDAAQDRSVKIMLDAEGKQRINTAALESGLWRAKILWTMNEEEYYFEQIFVLE
jgi:hypothetical protein